MDKFNYSYFTYLVGRVGVIPGSPFEKYYKLLNDLFHIEFLWDYSIVTDVNRADDGIYMRFLYFQETGKGRDYDGDLPCTVLEMLVGLSVRLETDLMGEPGNDHPERWFWDMINNLGLSSNTDDHYDQQITWDNVGRWMSRNYRPDGYGGLFPLHHPPMDQRRVPIWDQMSMYINENY